MPILAKGIDPRVEMAQEDMHRTAMNKDKGDGDVVGSIAIEVL